MIGCDEHPQPRQQQEGLEALAVKGQSPCPTLLAKLDWGLLDVLLKVLSPFASVTATMEADKHPTIGLVLGMVCLLHKQMDSKKSNNQQPYKINTGKGYEWRQRKLHRNSRCIYQIYHLWQKSVCMFTAAERTAGLA